MSSNLPPGLNESHIPGNRPQDVAFDQFIEGKIGDYIFENVIELSQFDPDEVIAALKRLMGAERWCQFCGSRFSRKEDKPHNKAGYCSSGCQETDEHEDNEDGTRTLIEQHQTYERETM